MSKTKEKIEFGDFQTPLELASLSAEQVIDLDKYDQFIEPTCGDGSFLLALLRQGIPISKLEGWEINPIYVNKANLRIAKETSQSHCSIVKEKDFFSVNFSTFNISKKNILFIGNPPWVTNSELGRLLSNNLPEKVNFQGLSGLEAMTGKSNFDISEWILIQLLKLISGKSSSIAFLVKTSVARKAFEYSCKNNLKISDFKIKHINAKRYFNANVDACLFLASGEEKQKNSTRKVEAYSSINDRHPRRIMGYVNGKLISDIQTYSDLSFIDAGSEFKWRSGIKHDASKIMEFDLIDGSFFNGLGEKVSIPDEYLFPMYKSSHISKIVIPRPSKFMLVTQKKIGENTRDIKHVSPATWEYLKRHSQRLDSRKSSIYKNSPRFSIFGVGDYTFKPYKIAISGFYKHIRFSKIQSFKNKPIVLDDTCYMLGFNMSHETDFILHLLNSDICQKFIRSIVFLDNKRPITVSLLNRINFRSISIKLDLEDKFDELFPMSFEPLKHI